MVQKFGENSAEKCISTWIGIIASFGILALVVLQNVIHIDATWYATWWLCICIAAFAIIQVVVKPQLKKAYAQH